MGFSRVQTRELTNSPCLYGVTNGTAGASKAVVLDANKDFTGIRNLTITGTLVAPTQAVTDSTWSVVDDGDATKVIKFQASGITTAKTLTLAGANTLDATITFPTATGTLATLAGTETFTNKTFTAPIFNQINNSGTITITGGTYTLVGDSLTQTLTAKTLTNPVVNGPIAVAVGSSLTINATSHVGAVIKLDTAGGSTATLPAATGTGNKYYFVVTTTATSNAHKILAASSSDNIIGIGAGENANTAKVFPATVAGTFHSIQMPFAGTQPSGGFQGDWFEFNDVATNLWFCRGSYHAGTTPTTPFSTATS